MKKNPVNRIIISTTGTSVANGVDVHLLANDTTAAVMAIEGRLKGLREKYLDVRELRRKLSAEINTLSALDAKEADVIYFLYSDTQDGLLCAGRVADLAETEFRCVCELKKIPGLQATDAVTFRRQGVQNLFRILDEIRLAHPSCEIVLNASGGFKSMVAYLTLYGLIYRQTVCYIFERSDQLIEFPPAPISFDYDRLKRAENAIATLREQVIMSRDLFFKLIPGLAFDEREWFESLVEQDGEHVALSAFGQLFVHQLEQQQAVIGLSVSALASRNKFDGSVRRRIDSFLFRLQDPLWRLSHQHAFTGTDLTVWKIPHTAYRIAGFEIPNRVQVAELYVDHDCYERELPGKNRRDFERLHFETWTPPSTMDLLAAGDQAFVDDMQAEIDQLKSQNAVLLEKIELMSSR